MAEDVEPAVEAGAAEPVPAVQGRDARKAVKLVHADRAGYRAVPEVGMVKLGLLERPLFAIKPQNRVNNST